MSYSDPSGQNVTLPTEQEALEQINRAHPLCEVCNRAVCVADRDGGIRPECFDCDSDLGQLNDGLAVHDGCREKYTMDAMAHDIEQTLRVRLPLGMDEWVIERSRNLAMVLYHEYVKPCHE